MAVKRALGIRLAAWLLALFAAVGHAQDQDMSLGLPTLEPSDPALLALGRKLFFDRRLSINGTLSCAMCHVPAQAFTSNELRTSVGMEGVSLRRNAPTLLNVGFVNRLFWDGRAATLEAQALQPMLHPDEMANPNLEAILSRMASLPEYRPLLRTAYGDPRPTARRLARAIAAYERSLVAGGSPFDRWRYGGQSDALGPLAQRGFALFADRGCVACHVVGARDALFSDAAFHNTGVESRSEGMRTKATAVALTNDLATVVTVETMRRIGIVPTGDQGRAEVTHRMADQRAFRTPSLRNVALTAPYMHDGSFASLGDVLDHYASGGTPKDAQQDKRLRPFALDPSDKNALIAFLESLTSPVAAILAKAKSP